MYSHKFISCSENWKYWSDNSKSSSNYHWFWATIDSEKIYVTKDVTVGLNELSALPACWQSIPHYVQWLLLNCEDCFYCAQSATLTHLWDTSFVFKLCITYPQTCPYIRFTYCWWGQHFYTWAGKRMLLLARVDLSLWCKCVDEKLWLLGVKLDFFGGVYVVSLIIDFLSCQYVACFCEVVLSRYIIKNSYNSILYTLVTWSLCIVASNMCRLCTTCLKDDPSLCNRQYKPWTISCFFVSHVLFIIHLYITVNHLAAVCVICLLKRQQITHMKLSSHEYEMMIHSHIQTIGFF